VTSRSLPLSTVSISWGSKFLSVLGHSRRLLTTKRRSPLFGRLEIETCSNCNRTCGTCLRNSYPDRERVESWFGDALLPTETVYSILDQAHRLGYQGDVNLQHYNEPLLDVRIEQFGQYVQSKGRAVGICTNGDFIAEERVKTLDGAFTWMDVALYMDKDAQAKRQAFLESMFSKTRLRFTGGGHMTTHFGPQPHLNRLIQSSVETPCFEVWRRMIISHKGEMLLCCDDMPGHFDLGNVFDSTLEQLWFSEKHQDIMWTLAKPGGRKNYAHCAGCPRNGGQPPPSLREFSGRGCSSRRILGRNPAIP
jgi:radical SAM protein with 4Fe4S-binding SPASM domain